MANFFKRFWWLFVIIGVIVIGFAAATVLKKSKTEREEVSNMNTGQTENKPEHNSGDNGNNNGNETSIMTEDQLAHANEVIAAGVSIDDEQNDWYHFPEGSIQGDGKPDNPNTYPLPYTDIRNVSFGADADYFYIKYTFWGEMPSSLQTYNEDDMKFFCQNVSISKYTDENGTSQVGMWQIGTSYIESDEKDKTLEATMNYRETTPYSALSSFGGQNGTDKNSEAIYTIQSSRGLVSGGAGYNYIIGAFPLSILYLQLGDTIEISIAYEANSRIYHHESVDLMLANGDSKEGDTIRYVLGSNIYENIGNQMVPVR